MSLKLVAASFLFSTLAACAAPAGDDTAATSSANETSGASVTFSAGSWTPTWSEGLAAGGELTINYDFARLPECRNQSRVDSWVVEVDYRFDGGATHKMVLPGSPGSAEQNDTIAIPAGAKSIEMWFVNHAVGGYDTCAAYDSQYGANYTHAL